MSTTKLDRRRDEDGSLICENGHLRLRVIQDGRSLGVMIDTPGVDTAGGALNFFSSGEDIHYQAADHSHCVGRFHAFDPLDIDGQPRGITLYGQLGEASMLLTVILDDNSIWCRQRLLVSGYAQPPQRLTQLWQLRTAEMFPEFCWPLTRLHGEALAHSPAAFLQDGPVFAALVADAEDADPLPFGLEVTTSDAILFEYGIQEGSAHPWPAAQPIRLSSALALDTRALPERGFQQVVRFLGSQGTLAVASQSAAQPAPGLLPKLHDSQDMGEWHPFVWEGTPEAIAAAVQRKLATALTGDWHALEEGLCWLDRLCLQQRPYGTPLETPLGAVGPGEAWRNVALWMPILLMQAFQLTGISEYAFRARAALHALPTSAQSIVLSHLNPAFGHLYAQADYQEVAPLSGPLVMDAHWTASGLELDVAPDDAATLRLVLDGSEDAYTVTVNGHPFGPLPAHTLRAGIDIRLTA